jgi:hypothetical protein
MAYLETLEAKNDALRDRCGALELVNEGLGEKAREALAVPPQTDLNQRAALLALGRLHTERGRVMDILERVTAVNGMRIPAREDSADWLAQVLQVLLLRLDATRGTISNLKDGMVADMCGGPKFDLEVATLQIDSELRL